MYASREAHSSIDKAVKLAGYGLELLRHIETDDGVRAAARGAGAGARGRPRGRAPAGLRGGHGGDHLVDGDRPAAGRSPSSAAATAPGCTWTPPTPAPRRSCPELRPLFDGMEQADSIVFNPHKWLLTNFDCTAYFVRDPAALLATFQATPEYLRTAYDADVVNFRDWGIQLGRRFRALKLWFVIRSYGVEGLRAMIRRHVALARELAGWVEADPDFELMAPVPFGLVCFRWRPAGRTEERARRAERQAARRGERRRASAT